MKCEMIDAVIDELTIYLYRGCSRRLVLHRGVVNGGQHAYACS